MINKEFSKDDLLNEVSHVISQLEGDVDFEGFNSEGSDVISMNFRGHGGNDSHLYKDGIFQAKYLKSLLIAVFRDRKHVVVTDLGNLKFKIRLEPWNQCC